ncbi:hypothetical protein BJ875DRAFT_449046 [Amylocarpus encephaloides]|uniref:3'(2'),5'-bisphosphate nucleotidase n=1 Tax=Amylocarpus encephaloides TaxID=45428 RepID=A0A9P7YU70_9HELO|nr:hypothetical protein BJ875DRAFT_449046 [Amylocarpus encephaloides]
MPILNSRKDHESPSTKTPPSRPTDRIATSSPITHHQGLGPAQSQTGHTDYQQQQRIQKKNPNRATRLTTLIFLPLIIVIVATLISKFWPRLSLLSHHFPSSSTPKLFFTTTTKMSTYSKELEVAELAVQRAAILTKKVFNEKAKGTISKDDASPVTIGDFGAQALIIAAIKKNFPDDEVVGEEEASTLREDSRLRDQIWSLVQGTKLTDEAAERVIGGPIESVDDMLTAIDAGSSAGGPKGRIWALDPIDGTKGFLRGGQYAVCLALMVDGDVKVGVLGCPNLPVDDAAPLSADAGYDQSDAEGKGVLFSAILGQGAISRLLTDGAVAESKPIAMKPVKDIKEAIFCESVEAGHSSHGDQAAIAGKLGITKPSVRMDSQSKYGSVARGAGDIYLRLPTSKTYQEKIWDHAAGDLIVREAGGQVTDTLGRRLDFSKGRTLAENKGVVAAPAAVHGSVLDVVKEVLSQK